MRYIELIPEDYDISSALQFADSDTFAKLFLNAANRVFFALTKNQVETITQISTRSRLQSWTLEHFLQTSVLQVPPQASPAWPEANIPAGASFADYLASETFSKRQNEFCRGFQAKSDIAVAAEKLFGGHLGLSDKVAIVDPYLLNSILRSQNEARRIFVTHFMSHNRALEVHTLSPWIAGKQPSYANIDGGDIYLKDDRDFERFLIEEIQTLALEASFKGTVEIHFWHKRGFSHDRHIQFQLKTEVGSSSDFFALGNGFDTLGDFSDEDEAAPKAQIYDSDRERMWSWRTSAGNIAQPIQSHTFLADLKTGKFSLKRHPRKTRW